MATGKYLLGKSGSETLTGGSGDDLFQGNGGADIFYGSAGSDTYIWKLGDGSDTIKEYSSSSSDIDVLDIRGVSSRGVTLSASGMDAILTIIATGEKITFYGQGDGNGSGVERILFSDTTWDSAQISKIFNSKTNTVIGTSASETLNGTVGADIIQGKGGTDILNGGAGSDTYVWNLGDGSDTISESSSVSSDIDVLQLNGVASNGVSLSKSGTSLYLTINATGEIIKLYGQGDGNGSGVERILFSDTTWDSAQISKIFNSKTNTVIGTSASETLNGTFGADMIQGNGGADNLYGGAGSDTYVWNLGDGSDAIYEFSSSPSAHGSPHFFGAGDYNYR